VVKDLGFIEARSGQFLILMIIPIILSGGIGKRLWPLSTEIKPKQFHNIISSEMNNLQYVIDKLGSGDNFKSPIVSCNYKHLRLVEESLQNLNVEIMVEPAIKGTAPVVCYMTEYLSSKESEESYILILPSDIFVDDIEEFHQKVQYIYSSNIEDIVCFGITPNNPDSNFGYICQGDELIKDLYRVKKFVEKPESSIAAAMIKESRDWFWNSGIFIGKIRAFRKEFCKLQPLLMRDANNIVNQLIKLGNKQFIQKEYYNFFIEAAFDKAILEKSDTIAMMQLNCKWYDVGNWPTLSSLKNQALPNVELIESNNCYVNISASKTVLLGLKDMIVVESGGKIFITTKEYSSQMKELIAKKDKGFSPVDSRVKHENWGVIKKLERVNSHNLNYLEILPGHVAHFNTFNNQNVCLVVIKGEAIINFGKKRLILESGKIFSAPINKSYEICNRNSESLYILEIINDKIPEVILKSRDHCFKEQDKNLVLN
jgi:mannose-1-phosphate guanylyltransferase